ncbi:MAG: DUF551 domain-containing protein [Clostridiales bacterium]|nr:DUF551 domain-containing protein [Clostridiales bacterium]MDY4113128.1 DUF551 domain-containing protein [Roseburia sp.]
MDVARTDCADMLAMQAGKGADMQEAFKIIYDKVLSKAWQPLGMFDEHSPLVIKVSDAKEIIEHAAAEYNNGWIPVEKRLPEVETEVLVVARRRFKSGECRYIITTAMYEDGTVSEYDSCWSWEDIEGEYDEENDCYIIPEGWWENRHYNPDEVYNNVVDDEVVAWQPLPEPYQPKGE